RFPSLTLRARSKTCTQAHGLYPWASSRAGVLMSLKRFLLVRLGRLLTYPVRRQLRQFEIACQNPEAVQTALLFDILRKQTDTQFGRDHRFGAITSVAEYR